MYKIQKLKSSEYFRNVFTVVSGTATAQFLPLLVAPVTSRIYLPEHYGVLGLYMSITMLAGVLATLNYANAIVIPAEDEEAKHLLKISIRNTHLISCLFLAGVLVYEVVNYFNHFKMSLGLWLYLTPLSVLLVGYTNSFTAYANRRKEYKLISANRITAVLLTITVSLTLGVILKNETGLILGFILGQLVNGLLLGLKLVKKFSLGFGEIFFPQTEKGFYKKYASFPKFSLVADFINATTNQIPILLMNSFAGATIVGLYNMSNRLLSLPISFISTAIGEVFRQRASEDIAKTGSCRTIFKKTFLTLVMVSIIPFVILLLFGPDLFAFFLGENWREAGVFSRIMAPVFLLRFINSPMSYIVYLVNKLRFNLMATIYLSTTSILIFLTLQFLTVYETIGLYALNYSLTYCFMLYKNYQFSKK